MVKEVRQDKKEKGPRIIQEGGLHGMPSLPHLIRVQKELENDPEGTRLPQGVKDKQQLEKLIESIKKREEKGKG